MSSQTLLFIDQNIPDYDIFIEAVKVPIATGFNHVDDNIATVSRIGFAWENNRRAMPFGSTCFGDTFYPSQELVDYLAQFQHPITVDFLTCELETPAFLADLAFLKQALPNVIFNYSRTLTGNPPKGNWIMETTGEDISPIYFNDKIRDYRHILALPDSNVLGSNFTYTNSSGVRTFTQNNSFTITSGWTQVDMTYSNNTDQVVVDGNNKSIYVQQSGFNGLFYVGNEYVGNNLPTIVKNMRIYTTVDVQCAMAQIIGYTQFQNNYIQMIGNIADNGGGMAYNSSGGSGIKTEITSCTIVLFGKVGENAGPLIGYISSNSGNIYTISNSCTVVADNNNSLATPYTLGSGAGAFVGSGVSNTVSISNSYCLFNGSMSSGSGIIGGKFLASNGSLTMSKFYAVANITYAPFYGDASNRSYWLTSYLGGGAANSFSLANVNILYYNTDLVHIYGGPGVNDYVDTLTGFATYTNYGSFEAVANTAGAQIGSDIYFIVSNNVANNFYSFTTNYPQNYSLNLTANTLNFYIPPPNINVNDCIVS